MINQSHHRDWRADSGLLESWRGLLAVTLSPGTSSLTLHYRSTPFLLGALLSALTLLLLTFLLLRSWRRRAVYAKGSSMIR